ncbi:hypothetical protein CSB45_03550 [candidate division KSB3 bacterium]|uniref:CheW-like domain-containing protein n=1 Tax=candidate division KSB3 bacterium TaxID=2044937 RepID=A0A2G6EA28_9BACT|nr:MAG: hypothetical protein CSB45_03550 [candidate division KSB3 bacterium]PIE29569.1 MAG: hypothetical protein CSA57_08145 [candidate division KSB3 bacterium]
MTQQQDISQGPTTEVQPEQEADSPEYIQLCIFELSGRLLALSIFNVQEILEDASMTPVPTTPNFLHGVINLRGDIVPIVDIREILGFQLRERTLDNRIMILNAGKTRFGILVDAISEVGRIEKRVIEQDASMLDIADGKFISNIVQYNDGLLVLLDVDALCAAVQL